MIGRDEATLFEGSQDIEVGSTDVISVLHWSRPEFKKKNLKNTIFNSQCQYDYLLKMKWLIISALLI